jgi:hypothetical protein
MKARRKSPVRNLLRFFEIALFFAISVLGYGLLAKTSTSGSKMKSRTLSTRLEEGGCSYGLQRELTVLARLRLFSRASGDELQASAFQVDAHPVANVTRRQFCHTPSNGTSIAISATAGHLPLPCNLLQQNPVLLT